jgi:hypothetical protein
MWDEQILNWFYTLRYVLHVQYVLYYTDSGQYKILLTFTENPTQSFIKISSGSTVYNTDVLTNMNSLYELRAKKGECTVLRNGGEIGPQVNENFLLFCGQIRSRCQNYLQMLPRHCHCVPAEFSYWRCNFIT